MRLFSFVSHSLKRVAAASVLMSLIVGFVCISFVHVFATDHINTELAHTQHTKVSGGIMMHSCCEASASDHLEFWKTISVSTIQYLLMLTVLGAALVWSWSSKLRLSGLISNSSLCYYHRRIGGSLADPYRLAISQGILNPKIF